VAGFPFRFEVRCEDATVALVSQTAGQAANALPVTARLREILVVAQVYDPSSPIVDPSKTLVDVHPPEMTMITDSAAPIAARTMVSAGQGGVTRREENPAFRCRFHRTVGGTDGVRGRAGDEGLVSHCASLRGRFLVASVTTPGCGATASSCTAGE